MRILHVIGSLGLGGAQICLKYIVENLNENVEQFVYPLRENTQIEIKGAILRFPLPNYDPRKLLRIWQIIKTKRIDIVHAHLHKPIVAALLLRYFCNFKLIVHEHGSITYSGWQYTLYRRCLKLLHRNADIYIAVSNDTAQWLKRAGVKDEKIKIIYNAVDSKLFCPGQHSKSTARKKFGIQETDIAIVFVGRLVSEKGADLAIQAMLKLLEKDKRNLLLLAGDGTENERLKELANSLGISERVRFLGFVQNMPEVLAMADIGVVPSRVEPFGIVALEFMQMQIPLVCSGVDGLAEFVFNEKNALVPPQNTPDQIADCINRLWFDVNLRQRLVQNGSDYVKQFSIDNQLSKIENVYNELIS